MSRVSLFWLFLIICTNFSSSLFQNSWIVLQTLRTSTSNFLPQILFSFLSMPFICLKFQREIFSYSFLRFISDLLSWSNSFMHTSFQNISSLLIYKVSSFSSSILTNSPRHNILKIDSFWKNILYLPQFLFFWVDFKFVILLFKHLINICWTTSMCQTLFQVLVA